MTLQDDFFDYINDTVEKIYPSWSKRPTKQWNNCYAPVNGNEKPIILVRKPNKDGTFWAWVSTSFEKISEIDKLDICKHPNDDSKYFVSQKNIIMSQIELIDRGQIIKNSWEKNWPIGFKIIERNQFEVAKKIIARQWK